MDEVDLFDSASLHLLALAIHVPGLNVVVAATDVQPLEDAVASTQDETWSAYRCANTFQSSASLYDLDNPQPLEDALYVTLPPLTLPESKAALQHMLCSASVPDPTAKLLHKCSGGNWTVLTEVTRALIESNKFWDFDAVKREAIVQQMDAVTREADKLQLQGRERVEHLKGHVVMTAMRGRLTALIHHLDGDTRHILCCAALVGVEFELTELEACLKRPLHRNTVLQVLTRACHQGLLHLDDWCTQYYSFLDHRYQQCFMAAALEVCID